MNACINYIEQLAHACYYQVFNKLLLQYYLLGKVYTSKGMTWNIYDVSWNITPMKYTMKVNTMGRFTDHENISISDFHGNFMA